MVDKKKAKSFVRWDVPPPADTTPYYPVRSPKWGRPVVAIILSEQLVGVWTHWVGRTTPCVGRENDCAGCKNEKPRRWKGFVAALDLHDGKSVHVEISHAAGLSLTNMMAGRPNWRGVLMTLTRRHQASNAPVDVSLDMRPQRRYHLPKEWDVPAALVHMWSGKHPPAWSEDTPRPDQEQLPFAGEEVPK